MIRWHNLTILFGIKEIMEHMVHPGSVGGFMIAGGGWNITCGQEPTIKQRWWWRVVDRLRCYLHAGQGPRFSPNRKSKGGGGTHKSPGNNVSSNEPGTFTESCGWWFKLLVVGPVATIRGTMVVAAVVEDFMVVDEE